MLAGTLARVGGLHIHRCGLGLWYFRISCHCRVYSRRSGSGPHLAGSPSLAITSIAPLPCGLVRVEEATQRGSAINDDYRATRSLDYERDEVCGADTRFDGFSAFGRWQVAENVSVHRLRGVWAAIRGVQALTALSGGSPWTATDDGFQRGADHRMRAGAGCLRKRSGCDQNGEPRAARVERGTTDAPSNALW